MNLLVKHNHLVMAAAAVKHYKIINSTTGNVIYYHSLSNELSPAAIKLELEKITAQVAVQNAIPVHTIYWEEVKAQAK